MPIIDIPTTSTAQTLTGDNGVTTVATYTAGGLLTDQGDNVQLAGANFGSGTPALEVDFSAAVEDLQFTFDDVDQNGWDDQVRVMAFAPDGTPIPITFTTTSATHVIESDGSNGVLQIEGSNATTDNNSLIVVTIPGPVGSIQIFYEDGNEQTNESGIIRLEDMSFTNAQPNDGTVSGTSGDDLIDGSYVGDPNGDRVDNDDAILAGDVEDDDLIIAGDGDDTVFAGEGDDEVLAGNNDDTVFGGAGNDIIDGGFGSDTLFGGDGDDILREGSTGSAQGTLYGGAGIDALFTGTGAANDELYGGDDDDLLIDQGTIDSDDTLAGGLGDDSIQGGLGDDTVVMEDNFGDDVITGGTNAGDLDVLDGSALTQDVTLNLSAPETGTLANGTDTASFEEIEEFILGSGDDSVIGSDGNDVVDLGQGTDTINAGEGDDLINLGEDSPGNPDEDPDVVVLEDDFGSDIITNFDAPTADGDGTFTGIDTLDVTNLFDAPVGDPDRDPVNTNDVVVSDDGSGNAVLTFPNGETLTLVGIAPADADDPFYLNAIGIPLPDGTVSGTAGDDLIDGSYLGDPDGDVVDGNDAVLAGDTGDDDLIEAGAGDDSVLAGAGDDEVFGGSGSDTISGGDENDTLIGGTGSDTLSGDDGDDILNGGADDDLLSGGAGDDVLDGGAGDDIFDLNDGFGTDVITGGETAEDLTDPTNGDQGDVIDASDMTTNTVLNLSSPEAGTLTSGTDTASFVEIEDVHLGSGNDTVTGSTDADIVDLGEGEDIVDAGAGDDVIGLGQDTDGTPDGDADVVTFSDGDGNDTILDFDAPIDNGDGTFTGIDTFDVSNLTDENGDPVNFDDVVVSDDGAGNAVLTFPNGETVTMVGIAPADVTTAPQLNAIGIPCFTPGTLISTENGLRPVEALEVGDLVLTRDAGMQAIRWVGQRAINPHQLAATPNLQPIRIKAGALGNGLPMRDVTVSPQHKMLLNDARAQLLFGEAEVLVAAVHLVGLPGIERLRVQEVTYVHIMFENHEIIVAEGAWTESYQPGPHVVGHMDIAQREELMLVFPELRDNPCAMKAARMTLKEREVRVLLD